MAKSKKTKKLAPNLFGALVEIKYGKGKKAQTVCVPVIVDFSKLYVNSWDSDTDALKDKAVDEVYYLDVKNTVLNLKDLKAAYKAYLKSEG